MRWVQRSRPWPAVRRGGRAGARVWPPRVPLVPPAPPDPPICGGNLTPNHIPNPCSCNVREAGLLGNRNSTCAARASAPGERKDDASETPLSVRTPTRRRRAVDAAEPRTTK